MRFEETAKKIGILALLAAVSASAAACGSENMVKAPVVGTLDPAQGGAAESGTAGAEGAEGNRVSDAGETAENGAAGMPGDRPVASGLTPGEQMQPPDRYTSDIRSEGLTAIADAPVIAEHLDSIGVRAVELAPYGRGDLTHFKKITEAQGITWGEQDESGWEEYGLIAGHSADGAYEFSFVSGEKKQSTPLFWMSSLVTTYGSSADFDGGDISGMSFTEEERTALEEQFKERSEEILQQLGGGEFVLRDMRWRALRHLAGTGGWEFSGDYALLLEYVKMVDGVMLPHGGSGYINSDRGQYVTFVYGGDGTLLELKDISRETVGELETGVFYLPFESISQIFEQYCRTYYSEITSSAQENDFAPVAGLDILVDEVRLEYWMELDGETGKGEIFPVWSFAGHTKTRYETGMEERISGQWVMLTVDARDGNILQTWVQIN